jgi:hypothetical protein
LAEAGLKESREKRGSPTPHKAVKKIVSFNEADASNDK